MDKTVRRKLRSVRRRCSVNRLLENLQLFLLVVGVLALAVVVVEKVLALGMVSPGRLAMGVGAGVLAALVGWQVSRPGSMQLAVWLDERANLRERMSSLLAFADTKDPFARAAVAECRQSIAAVRPGEFFPIRVPSRVVWTFLAWGLVIAAWRFLPQGDLLGKTAQRQEQAAKAAQVLTVQTEAQAAVKKVRELGEKMEQNLAGDPTTAPAKDVLPKEPQAARQLAVRQIADLQQRVQEARANAKFEGMQEMSQKLRQLRSPDVGPVRDLTRQLARGEFDKAAASLRALRQKLEDKNLSPQQRTELARQLEDLAKQLEALAKQQWKLDNEMKKIGLDPALAKDLKKLQEALKKLPLTEEQKKKLMKLAQATNQACKSCNGLGEALGSAATSLSGGDKEGAAGALGEAGKELNSLEALQQQLQLADATLSDLKEAMKKLGQGTCTSCNGQGCAMCGGGKGPWKPGLSEYDSAGMGGPGHGRGQVADVEKTDTQTDKSRVHGQTQGGPTIASWYVQDREIRGQSLKGFSEVTQNAQQEAAEAIGGQHIPKEYHDSVKKYFSQLHQSAQSPTTQKGP